MRIHVLGASFVALATLVGCSSGNGSQFGDGGTGSSSGGSSSGGSSSGGTGSSSGGSGGSSSGIIITAGDGGTSSGGGTGDGGFVCDPNPLNYEIPNNGCDDDGDGKVDNAATPCDTGSVPSSLAAVGTAADLAAAIGLCQAADTTHWGVVSATYTKGHSATTAGALNFNQQHGTLGSFGSVIKPREGSLLGVISSGSATAQDSDSGPLFKGDKNGMQGAPGLFSGNSGDVPSGFPKSTATCNKISSEVNDVIDVKLVVKVPANAKGFSFDFDFWSGEWPDYVCTEFNDSFIAYLSSAGFNNGTPDNISFDSNNNTISVNNNFFQSCTAGITTGCQGGVKGTSTCTLGPAELAGTGFDDPGSDDTYCSKPSTSGGATSWLTSTAPLKPGETATLEFIIWDTGDASYDSSALLDNWVWSPSEVPATPITVTAPPK